MIEVQFEDQLAFFAFVDDCEDNELRILEDMLEYNLISLD
jgi:hypothetical protein